MNLVTKRKKRRSWFSQNPALVSVCLPKHPTMAPKAVKTLFLLSWSENTSILLQTLAENRVSAFLYLLLLPELEIWIGELFMESQTCNNITMPIEQSQSSKSLRFFFFFNWKFSVIFLNLTCPKLQALVFFFVLKSRDLKYGCARMSNHCNSTCVGLIARSVDFQSNVRTRT